MNRRQTCPVPSLFRQSRENSGSRPPTPIAPGAGEALDEWHWRCSTPSTPDNTQIYEGTNQIQRVVMARQLLKS
jgi:hypothetical protein